MEQVRADERRDEGVRRPGDELRRRRELAERAVDDHADLVRERRGVLVVVRDEERGEGELAQELVQLASHLRLRVRVECRQRLVEEQDGRLPRKSARECDALALTAGERAGPRVGDVRDAEPLEQLVDARLSGVCDVRAHAQVRKERVFLEDEPDATLLGPPVDAFGAVEPDLVVECDAAVGPRQAGDDPQHRRLARARRPDERNRALDMQSER